MNNLDLYEHVAWKMLEEGRKVKTDHRTSPLARFFAFSLIKAKRQVLSL